MRVCRPMILPKSHATGRHRGGYSLVELIIVLAILVVLWGIAAPRYSNSICLHRSEEAARRIAADLNLARSQAMMTSKSQTVIFDTTYNTYSMAGVTGLDNRAVNYNVNLAADPYDCTFVSVNFNNTTQVTFDRFGSSDNAGQIIVQCGGIQTTVTLESSAGKATVP